MMSVLDAIKRGVVWGGLFLLTLQQTSWAMQSEQRLFKIPESYDSQLNYVVLQPPNAPLDSQLLQSFEDPSTQKQVKLKEKKWFAHKSFHRHYGSTKQPYGNSDPRGFGPSLNASRKVDPNGPNGPGMPGGSPMY